MQRKKDNTTLGGLSVQNRDRGEGPVPTPIRKVPFGRGGNDVVSKSVEATGVGGRGQTKFWR